MAATQSLSTRTGLSTTPTEHWFEVRQGHMYVPLSISITAGTATLVIEGRNSPLDAAVTLTTVSATDAQLVQRMNQIRVRYTAAAGATVQVSVDTPAIDTGA